MERFPALFCIFGIYRRRSFLWFALLILGWVEPYIMSRLEVAVSGLARSSYPAWPSLALSMMGPDQGWLLMHYIRLDPVGPDHWTKYNKAQTSPLLVRLMVIPEPN